MAEELETLVDNKPANPITEQMQQTFQKNIWGDVITPTTQNTEEKPIVDQILEKWKLNQNEN